LKSCKSSTLKESKQEQTEKQEKTVRVSNLS